ncbi:response regulator transcription factor [Fischerella thermalis]|jgi:CheY-like chemotaxis protein|uniref:Response regulator receiver protein n=2 Tax=Fischerella TaxID=1190 RepID=G6FW25_9CYAN|nr:response regulator [Fischerella thermalis]PLZ80555.1 response regulator [Fischerella thermalis WC217]PMB01009.1 response regulator [Fischerella thermalis CCMEE 5328]PMB08096.1 response regulator [Fischerella thermalis CCMEE 5282]PMB10699.1 response regulator [Fischerella thermalis CCMEE 5273]RDH50232.1 response regulator [Mastigocladus laminosus WC112]
MSYLFLEENLNKKQILVVDDVIDNSLLLATILESEGYQVDIASSGYTAIAKIEANPPSLVLLDLMMPELDGYEVAKWIRQNQPSVAIVIVTAYDELPTFDQQQLQIDGFLHKPINIDELLMQVQAILEK